MKVIKKFFSIAFLGIFTAKICLFPANLAFANTDTTSPVFEKITLKSSNTKNPNFAKEGDKITMSLFIDPEDSWKKGNNVTFVIGAGSAQKTKNYTESKNTPIKSRNRNYKIKQ